MIKPWRIKKSKLPLEKGWYVIVAPWVLPYTKSLNMINRLCRK